MDTMKAMDQSQVAAIKLPHGDFDLLRSAIDSPEVGSEALKRLFERAGE